MDYLILVALISIGLIKKEGSKPPKAAGEYRIRDSKGKMQYVGITNDLNRRMHEHENTGRLKNNAGASFECNRPRREHRMVI